MLLPLIMTLVIALPFDQVLQAVVTHAAVQYLLDLILFLTIDEGWGWWWRRSSARDGIWMCKEQLDNWEDWVEAAELGRENEAVCTLTDALVDNKWAQMSVRQFR
jgi:hypothetical protein